MIFGTRNPIFQRRRWKYSQTLNCNLVCKCSSRPANISKKFETDNQEVFCDRSSMSCQTSHDHNRSPFLLSALTYSALDYEWDEFSHKLRFYCPNIKYIAKLTQKQGSLTGCKLSNKNIGGECAPRHVKVSANPLCPLCQLHSVMWLMDKSRDSSRWDPECLQSQSGERWN